MAEEDDDFLPEDEGAFLSVGRWQTNGDMMVDIRDLGGIIDDSMSILDVTYGEGTFWNRWVPPKLTACDLHPRKSPIGYPVNFTKLPFDNWSFEVVVFDPPYKLNGRPSEPDERYGVHVPAKWQDRMELMRMGLIECCRVASKRVLVKCKDQVARNKVRWQTRDMAEVAELQGFGQSDRFDMISYRRQPDDGRTQRHSRRITSTLLVFEHGLDWRK